MAKLDASIFSKYESGSQVDKGDYEAAVPDLRVDLVNNQYLLRSSKCALLILIAGNDRKSVNEAVDLINEWMDARYIHTNVFLPPSQLEKEYPSYWRFWQNLPPFGRIGCFLGGWTMQALRERTVSKGSKKTLDRRIQHIKMMEQTLQNNGTTMLKFWLHVPRENVKKQLEKAKKDPASEPYLDQKDWEAYEQYDKTLAVSEYLIENTHTDTSPWHIIEASNKRHRNLTVAKKISEVLGHLVNAQKDASVSKKEPETENVNLPDFLGECDLTALLAKDEYKMRLKSLQGELNDLAVKARGLFSTVLVFEGWDAAGKGGAIRRITKALYAQDYRVVPIAAPSEEEKKYHYLWRFWRRLPRQGRFTIFDRSWYGRVLVERVEGFASGEEWQRAYDEINDFEQQLIHHNMVVCKFWLHIDPEEQLNRFKSREALPYKNHKITDDDYRNRDKWPAYTEAVNEMIARTSKNSAPWHVIPANNKRWARVEVLQIVVDSLKKQLQRKH